MIINFIIQKQYQDEILIFPNLLKISLILNRILLQTIIIIIYQLMQKKNQCVLEVNYFKIGQKNFRIPQLQLSKVTQYFQTKIPKETKQYKQRKFYAPEELKQMQSKLTCGIKKPKFQQKPVKTNVQTVPKPSQNIKKQEPKLVEQPKKQEIKVEALKQIKVQKRPTLAKEGPTHFIMIPLEKELSQMYTNQLVPSIQQQIVKKQALHITLLAFKLKQQKHLDEWNSILKQQKKKKLRIKGIGMIGQKNRYARRLYLNVLDLDDLIHSIISKGLQKNLITQNQLIGHIKFDKKKQQYKLERPHVTILRTQGKDLIDVQNHLKSLKDIASPPIPITQFRISVIGSFSQGTGYYNESVIHL